MSLLVVLSPLVWLARLLLFGLLALAGFPLIGWQRRYLDVRESKYFPGRWMPQFRATWMALYCNEEDGVDGLRGWDPAQRWWAQQTSGWSQDRRIFVWCSQRNPVDSLRWALLINPKIDAARVRFVGMDHQPAKGESGWYFAWLARTAYACIRWEFALPRLIVLAIALFAKSWRSGEPVCMRLWLGTKLHPEDRNGLALDDPRAIRCDFAIQFKRVA